VCPFFCSLRVENEGSNSDRSQQAFVVKGDLGEDEAADRSHSMLDISFERQTHPEAGYAHRGVCSISIDFLGYWLQLPSYRP